MSTSPRRFRKYTADAATGIVPCFCCFFPNQSPPALAFPKSLRLFSLVLSRLHPCLRCLAPSFLRMFSRSWVLRLRPGAPPRCGPTAAVSALWTRSIAGPRRLRKKSEETAWTVTPASKHWRRVSCFLYGMAYALLPESTLRRPFQY
jgi:hypothetical protein